MYSRIILTLIFLLSSGALHATSYYENYTNLRDSFEKEKALVNTKIHNENKRYIQSLNSYQLCSSDKWRVAFISIVPKIEKQIFALGNFKRAALKRSGILNSEWLKTAQDHKISRIKPDEDITDFFLWYQGQVQLMRQGPLHDLEVYTIALSKLTGVYEKMALACSGDSSAAKDFDVVKSGISGLIDQAVSLIGKVL